MKVVTVAKVAAENISTRLFTAPVTRQALVTGDQNGQFSIYQVNFGKGVRNKFHSHTYDQALIVTEGKGICATEQEEITVTPGDFVLFPAGEKHWHGATADSTFSHIYVTGPDSKTTQYED